MLSEFPSLSSSSVCSVSNDSRFFKVKQLNQCIGIFQVAIFLVYFLNCPLIKCECYNIFLPRSLRLIFLYWSEFVNS